MRRSNESSVGVGNDMDGRAASVVSLLSCLVGVVVVKSLRLSAASPERGELEWSLSRSLPGTPGHLEALDTSVLCNKITHGPAIGTFLRKYMYLLK